MQLPDVVVFLTLLRTNTQKFTELIKIDTLSRNYAKRYHAEIRISHVNRKTVGDGATITAICCHYCLCFAKQRHCAILMFLKNEDVINISMSALHRLNQQGTLCGWIISKLRDPGFIFTRSFSQNYKMKCNYIIKVLFFKILLLTLLATFL